MQFTLELHVGGTSKQTARGSLDTWEYQLTSTRTAEGQEERRRRTGDAFIYSSGTVSHFYLLLRIRACMCASPRVRDEMLFTKVAVSARQLLCTVVNLWLIYPSLPHFWLIRTALSLSLPLTALVLSTGGKMGPILCRTIQMLSLFHPLKSA